MVDEIIPKFYRGRTNIILGNKVIKDGTWHLGAIIASLLSILNGKLDFDWTIYFLMGGLGALPLVFYRSKIPESPRWLIK